MSNFYEIPYGSSLKEMSIKRDFLENRFSNSHSLLECLVCAITYHVTFQIWVNMENLPVMLLNNYMCNIFLIPPTNAHKCLLQ